ncbi:MAG TPA: hypothetical protein VM328_03630 [Fimbriimonadaceae bacterium]|nr:hypothetical protein [Fimbriimonadaceae bacterium]
MKHPILLTLLSLAVVSSAAVAPLQSKVAGTWMVANDGKPNPNMKLILDKNGNFKFAGSNYSSAGKYRHVGNKIDLNWTMVDGQKVKPGQMKKTLELNPDNTFKIDRFTYKKFK